MSSFCSIVIAKDILSTHVCIYVVCKPEDDDHDDDGDHDVVAVVHVIVVDVVWLIVTM